MNKVIFSFVVAFVVSGCASMDHTVEKVEIPLPIPCNIVPPSKPAMPFTDVALSDDIFTNTKRALAEIQLRIGYEAQLESAIQACNSK